MIVQQVFDTVSRQIARLQKMPDHPRKAALAELRRGVGHVPGELPELWGSFLQEMPPDFFSQNGEPTAAEWAVYSALTLFALHQQGQEKPMWAPKIGLGKAVRRLSDKKGEEPEESGAYRRFCALITAGSMEEVSHHLRGLIQLLRSESLPLDYPQLAQDLFLFQFADSAPRVKLRWGQDYFSQPKDSIDELEKEDHDE